MLERYPIKGAPVGDMSENVDIKTDDVWVKVVEMLQQN